MAGLAGWQGAAVGATIGQLTYDLSTFCPGGPPAAPTFSIGDIAALLAPIPTTARSVAAAKLQDFLGVVFWPIFCSCVGGASVIPAPSPYPTGGPQSTPTAVPGTPCLAASGSSPSYDSLPGIAGTLKPFFGNFASGPSAGSGPAMSAGATYYTLTVTTTAAGANHNPVDFQLEFFDASGAFINSLTGPHVLSGTTVTTTGTISGGTPSSWASVAGAFVVTGVPHTSSDTVVWALNFYCGTGPGQIAQPCCPPDPVLQAQILQILEMVTLIQRQEVPFAYVPGATHAGLTGVGSFAIPALVGAKIDVTSSLALFGSEGSSPSEYFDLGFVTWATPDGYPTSVRIEHQPTLTFPTRAALYTEIFYDLHPGVTVTITELVREP